MRQMLVALALTTSMLTSGANLGRFEGLWNLLSPLWSGSAGSDAGCIMDPNGHCRPATQFDEGCIMDPDGQCRPAPQIDAGCIMDPYGQCRPADS